MPKIWRILSIDGGGIRGLIPATILSVIEERTGKQIAKLFDIIAGTSTGAILTLGLTRPDQFGQPQHSGRSLRELYEVNSPQIFRHPASWWENLLRPKYNSSAGITKIMEDNFGDARLKSAITDVLIPCYDIEHRSPHIFKSRWARRQHQYDFRMSEVARAASATPTMFEPVRLPRPFAGGYVSLVDGGVFANNPTLLALSEISSRSIDKDDDFLVVSLGTGESMERMTRKYISDWGYIRWSIPMIELVSESISEAVHGQVRNMLPATTYQRYYRFQADLPDDTYYALDDASRKNMDGLIHASETLLGDPETNREMDQLCEMLLKLSEKSETEGFQKDTAGRVAVTAGHVATSVDTFEKAESLLPGNNSTTAVNAEISKVTLVAGTKGSNRTKSATSLSKATAHEGPEEATNPNVNSRHEAAEAPTTNISQFQFQVARARGYQVALCHAEEDFEPVVQPLVKALKARGVRTIIEKFGWQPKQDIRRVVSQAAEASLINIVVLSPSLLKNKWASRQLEWLYTRTLSGKNVILPVVHGFARKDVSGLVHHLHWHKMPGQYLEYLMDLAEGTTADGIEPLADRVALDVIQWLS